MAKEFKVETYLFCENCLEDTMHRAIYRDGEIVKLTCLMCNNEIMLNKKRRKIGSKGRFSGLFSKIMPGKL